jgi:hypothetical protein
MYHRNIPVRRSRNITEYNIDIGTPNDPTKILCTKSNRIFHLYLQIGYQLAHDTSNGAKEFITREMKHSIC